MDTANYRFFEVTGDNLREVAEKYFAEVDAVNSAREAFGRKMRAKQLYATSHAVIGVVWPKKRNIPAGWKRDRYNSDVIVPDRRRKAGKEAAKRLNDLAAPKPTQFREDIGVSRYVLVQGTPGRPGMRMLTTKVGRIAGCIYCHVPREDGWEPPTGLYELRGAEMLAIMETAEAA